ncbi:MAG: hypothetical protein V3S43_03520 [Acidimicrobiia bacterium]
MNVEKLRPVRVTIEDDNVQFAAFDQGTEWNGFTDYVVSRQTWRAILDRMHALGMSDRDEGVAEDPDECMGSFTFKGGEYFDLGGGAFVILSEVHTVYDEDERCDDCARPIVYCDVCQEHFHRDPKADCFLCGGHDEPFNTETRSK